MDAPQQHHPPPSDTSSTSSPEATGDDDTADFFMAQPNDSQSSIGVLVFGDMSMTDKDEPLPPVYRLPPELMINVMSKLSSSADLLTCMQVSKAWASASVELLWHRPMCNSWAKLAKVVKTIQMEAPYFAYPDLVKRLNLAQVTEQITDGTLNAFAVCSRIERLTLTGCNKVTDAGLKSLLQRNKSLMALDLTSLDAITDASLQLVAQNCKRLQGLNVTGCSHITEASLIPISKGCSYVKRLKFNDCELATNEAIIAFAQNCPYLLEIDLHKCRLISDPAVSALIQLGGHLRELRLAYCELITDEAFMLPPGAVFESLRILDLTACERITDSAITNIVGAAPRLRNLVLAKCRNITDVAVQAISRLGKNLHYIHLGHCSNIQDAAVMQLIKSCNRIRYIDLACCHRLTDRSIETLAHLPKLRRIGLVKCINISDNSILALARHRHGHVPMRDGRMPSQLSSCSLERVHLSYCTQLTVHSIHALLNHCPRLTHLSLTGIQAFLRLDITSFCREAPPEFTEHQRDVFCVFSGAGVIQLRAHLNEPEVLQHAMRPQAQQAGVFTEGDNDGEQLDGEDVDESELE